MDYPENYTKKNKENFNCKGCIHSIHKQIKKDKYVIYYGKCKKLNILMLCFQEHCKYYKEKK